MNPETVALLSKIVIFMTCPAAIGFPIWYHLKLRWRRSEMGRHVMGYSSVVAFLYLQALVGIFWPLYPGRMYAGLLLAVLMMVVIWWRVIVFVHIRRQADREERAKEEI